MRSRDGRGIDAKIFNAGLARFEMLFGRNQLRGGVRAIGVRALFSAWRRDPHHLRYLGLALAGMAGYTPRADDIKARADA